MLLIVEIALLVMGIIAMVKKKWSIGGGKVVLGGHAQVLGAIAAFILPFNLLVGVGAGVFWGMTRPAEEFPALWASLFEAGVVVAAAILLAVLGKRFYAKQEAVRAQEAVIQADMASRMAQGE